LGRFAESQIGALTIEITMLTRQINTLRNEARGLAKNTSKRLSSAKGLTRQNERVQKMMVEPSASSSADLRTVCEDAVTIVAAAYMYNISTPDQPFYHVFTHPEPASHLSRSIAQRAPSVTIILNITPGVWNFTMLTGSFQRIIMNLVANGLKYTQSGFIKVSLCVREEHREERDQSTDHYDSIVELSVIDSGRGISKEFLRTKLFSAFAQESTLAPGTGKI